MKRFLCGGLLCLLLCTEALAQAIVLPCVPSGNSCIPVSAANPLPTTGGGGGSGTITSSTATYVTVYSAATTVNGYAGLTYTDPGQVAITRGVGVTSGDGLLLTNTTSAAAGAQQWSPRLHFTGQGWKTAATAASQTVDFIEELQTIQGAANPTANLVWSSNVNAAGYVARMSLSTGGVLNVAGAGSAATPTLTVGNITTGLYSVSTTGLGISVNGTLQGDLGITTGSFWTFSTNVSLTNNLYLPTTSSTAGSIYFNNARFFHAFGGNNLFVGNNSGNYTLSGSNNVGVGASTLVLLTSGFSNNAIGPLALAALTTGSSNTAVGGSAGAALTSGAGNVIVGSGMLVATTDANNVSIGNTTLGAANGSFNDVAIGYGAAPNLTTASASTFVGQGTGAGITTGSNNTVIGAAVTGLSAGLTGAIILANGAGSYQLDYGVTTASTWTTSQAVTFSNATIKLTGVTTGTNADTLCLSATGTVLIQAAACTISTLRFKPDWKLYTGSAMAVVRQLEVGTFHLNSQNRDPNAASLQIGLNAENIANVLPMAVIYEDDMTTPKSYRQEGVIALYGSALQETDIRLDRLRADNDNLRIEFEIYKRAHP